MSRRPLSQGLPDFPWDLIAEAGAKARSHPDGIVDLSIGTPVDDTPELVQQALAKAANAPGYPTAMGSVELREALAGWARTTLGATAVDVQHVAPAIGSKELIALLPFILGLNSEHTVAIPELAYPTYAVAAQMVGAKFVTYSDADDIPANADVVWINSPSNPTGRVLTLEETRAHVNRARDIGAIILSDECYIELDWTAKPYSVIHSDVVGNDFTNILTLHSLSKRSNLAGYRSGSAIGDPKLIAEVIGARKHMGLLMPTPIQMATVAALGDSAHVAAQKAIYANRREILHTALTGAGFTISHSQAGLYLWSTRGQACMETVDWLANKGILVAPGNFYGPAGAQHVRVALTGTDERVQAAATRLSE